MMTNATANPAAVKVVEQTLAAGKAGLDATLKAGQDVVVQTFDQAVAMGEQRLDALSAGMAKALDDMTAQGKANMDAVTAASAVVTAGAEDLGKECVAYARSAWAGSAAAARAMLGARDAQQVLDLQAGHLRAALDGLQAESAKLSEMTLKVANDALAPLGARTGAVMKMPGQPRAA